MTELSEKGARAIRQHEGFVDHAYLDPVNVLTIGIGFTWRSGAFRSWWASNRNGPFDTNATMTRAEAEECLRYIVKYEYGKMVNDFFGPDLAQNVFDGCTSVVYNLGPVALDWTWAEYIRDGDISRGAQRLEVTGITADGVVLPGLMRRRKAESVLIEYGIYGEVDTSMYSRAPADAMADGVLRRGEAGPAVAQLIRGLHALGYYQGVMDDVFGHGTEAAVLKFQRDHKLKPDGLAGPRTLSALRKEIGVDTKRVKGGPAAIGAGIVAAVWAFACNVPFLSSLFDSCTK